MKHIKERLDYLYDEIDTLEKEAENNVSGENKARIINDVNELKALHHEVARTRDEQKRQQLEDKIETVKEELKEAAINVRYF